MFKRPSQLTLRTQFTLVLTLIFIVGIVVSWGTLWFVLEQRAQEEVTARSRVLIETMNAVRHYTSNYINPLLQESLLTSDHFISETVPAYSASTVFENLRQRDEHYALYLYKEATLNPTNQRDLANGFETELVNQFREQPTLSELSGYTQRDGVSLYYSARPLTVSSESCMACHSSPEIAPESLIATFGSQNGFGWSVGETIAAQIVYVPADDIAEATRLSMSVVMITVTAIFGSVILLVNILLKGIVIRPMEKVATVAQKVGSGKWSDESDLQSLATWATRHDEIGHLARITETMARQVKEREDQLKKQVMALTIQIDQQKQSRQVAEITETEYFRDLQKKVKKIRSQSSEEITQETPEQRDAE